MNVIGISAHYHESACCLVRDGVLVAAASEERFTRVKHDPSLPVQAFKFCLAEGGIDLSQIDRIAYYEDPQKKLARQLWAAAHTGVTRGFRWIDTKRAEREIRGLLGFEGPIEFFDHHLSHAASSYYCSGFSEAAVLTVDGVGEWATTTYGEGAGAKLRLIEEETFPDSLGLLYSTITAYLGFRVLDGEYKVMGLAPYGRPKYVDLLAGIAQVGSNGHIALDMSYFDFLGGEKMWADELERLLPAPPREPESDLAQEHLDLARSVQQFTQDALLEKVKHLHQMVPSARCCLAGGVALNCVANGYILRNGPFEEIYVQPASGDAGGCIGAALLACADASQAPPLREPLRDADLGPSYTAEYIERLLEQTGIEALDFRHDEYALLEAVVDRLARGKILGWFHGRMEFGPRALGRRSIIADPRGENTRDKINEVVKKREGFRPFAPSVRLEDAAEHFDLDHPSPFMLEVCQIHSALALPAITHVDGSARPQTVHAQSCPRYWRLIEEFGKRTGCPVLLNTAFNVRGEPIVCSPEDAFICLANSELDGVVLEDFVIDRAAVPGDVMQHLAELAEQVEDAAGSAQPESAVYTFG